MALGTFNEALLLAASLDQVKAWLSGNVGAMSLPAKPRILDIDQIEIESAHTTTDAAAITADSLTTGKALNITSNSSSTGTRSLLFVRNDNTAATGTVVADLRQDAANTAVQITQSADAAGLVVSTSHVTSNGINVTANALTSGNGVIISSSATAMTSGGRLLCVDHTGATSTSGIIAEVKTAATDETALLRLQSGGTGNDLQFINTNTGALGPKVEFYHNVGDSAAADNDVVARLIFYADDEESSSTKRQLMKWDLQWTDATGASFASDFEWYMATGAAENLAVTLSGAGLLSVDADGGGSDDPVSLFDDYDDALVLQMMSVDRPAWAEKLTEMGIFRRKDSGCGYMMGIQKFMYLLAGGIYQNRDRIDGYVVHLELELDELKAQLRNCTKEVERLKLAA